MVVTLLSMLLPLPEHRRKGFRWYLLAGFALAAASVLIDAVRPGTFSWQTDRAAGFAVNPNTAGFLLITLCCSIISFDRVRLVDVAVLVVTAACVLATLSRGAAVMFACVIAFYGFAVVRHGWQRRVRFLVGGSAALVLLLGGAYLATRVVLDQKMFGTSGESARQRMLMGREPIVRPGESRIVVAEHAWDLIRESPFMGYGSGFTYTLPIGPHNIYLSRWLDLGLPGILAVLWLLAAMGLTFSRRRYPNGVVFTAVVALEGFFSHNLLEERIFFVLLGVLLTCSVRESAEPVTQTMPSRVPIWRPPERAPGRLDGVAIHR
jgi:O-antigen ligase